MPKKHEQNIWVHLQSGYIRVATNGKYTASYVAIMICEVTGEMK